MQEMHRLKIKSEPSDPVEDFLREKLIRESHKKTQAELMARQERHPDFGDRTSTEEASYDYEGLLVPLNRTSRQQKPNVKVISTRCKISPR